MIESLFSGLINFILWLINLIGSIFLYPIQAILVTIIPSFGDFLGSITQFFNESIFPLICFLKTLFLNITCCPVALYSLVVAHFFAVLGIALSVRVLVLIYKIYFIVRGSKG